MPCRAAKQRALRDRMIKNGPRSENQQIATPFFSSLLEAKSKAAKVQEPSGLWDLEHYLTRRRQEVDRVYDYRYSILPLVFANLISKGRLVEDELHGLGEDKLG